MRSPKQIARRGFLAAILALSSLVPAARAETSAMFQEDTGGIVVAGLRNLDRNLLQSEPARVRLQVDGLSATRGMPVTVSEDGAAVRIKPRFALRTGTAYELRLDLNDTVQSFEIALPAGKAPTPKLSGFAPSQAVIPSNTLRLYLTFSEPMARGTLRNAITLLTSAGTEVPSPFLTLGPELWDVTQTRVTLLFDPGRIKQGVGPNISHGTPLVAGERYRLVIDTHMESAEGIPLEQDVHVAFRVGPPELRPIDPGAWQILAPEPGTIAPLSLAFARIMDSGAVRRLIALEGPNGKAINGTVETDGGGWSLVPRQPWAAGNYSIIVDPQLEDVSGNAVGQAFDAAPGTIGLEQREATLDFRIGD